MDVGNIKHLTIKAKLVAYNHQYTGHITYVFENLEEQFPFKYKYVMCTRYPNWDHRGLKLFEEGFLTFEPVIEGIDTYFDGFNHVPYKYSAIRFISFIELPNKDKIDNAYVL